MSEDKLRNTVSEDFEEDPQPPYYSRNKGGRPSKYDPKYCDEIVEFMAQGYSLTAFAAYIGVARDTVYEWADKHENFSDALERAKASAALWWEGALRNIASGMDGNATAAIFGLKNRGMGEWRDRKETEVTGKDGGPVQTESVSQERLAEAISALSDDERSALRPLLAKLTGES